MVKKAILLLSAVAGISGFANAQRCATDELQKELIKLHPSVANTQQALDMQWHNAVSKVTAASYAEFQDSIYNAEIAHTLYIPVVVHIMHDYGTEYISDDDVFQMMKTLNIVYAAKNDQSSVIPAFKPYIGKPNIEFRLAQKDPQGNPTNGITRRQTYLTKGGDEQAKMDQWAPDRYLNIWIEKVIGRGVNNGTVLAYATLPSGASGDPYSDGVIVASPYINDATQTVAHEVGHYLNLYHPWNSSQQDVAQACGDDEVDDTPPTTGHFSTCNLNDSTCAQGYKKTYSFSPGAGQPLQQVTIDYPDTTNVQNIMDYSSCTNMFTKQQVLRMHATLKNAVANRNNLVLPVTHTAAGIFAPTDIAPVAEFSLEKGNWLNSAERTYYMCANQPSSKTFIFKNRSWRDTVTSVQWEFSNGGGSVTQTGNATQLAVAQNVVFTQPGWATVKLTATSNAGTGVVETKAVYVADPNYRVPAGYYQEFAANEYDQWPAFNYYNNESRWEVTNQYGYYDQTSIVYKGFDSRVYPYTKTNNAGGDYDDFFTPAYDLSGMTSGNCNINFMSAGVFRTTNATQMNDKLQLAYSTDCGASWVVFDSLKKTDLANKGSFSGQFAPLWQGDWKLQSRNIPAAARTGKTFFRFRYVPSVCTDCMNGGNTYLANSNNFFIDRINVSPFPLGVNTIMAEGQTVKVAPNPTTGSSFVLIDGNNGATAQVQVTDMTGKVVYRIQQQLNGAVSRIEIPASAIAVKGVYVVQVVTGDQTHTEKLVSY